MYDFRDVEASIYDRKTAAQPFDTTDDILRSLSLAQSLLKDQNALIEAGTEGLSLRRYKKKRKKNLVFGVRKSDCVNYFFRQFS